MEALQVTYQTLLDGFLLYIGIILALVQFVKEAGNLQGAQVRWASFGIGIVIAGVYFASSIFPSAAIYIQGLFFILTIGLVASGAYDLGVRVRDGA